jgi:hypothetical protein
VEYPIPGKDAGTEKQMPSHHSLSISMEHFPEGMGRVFFFFPRMLMVK